MISDQTYGRFNTVMRALLPLDWGFRPYAYLTVHQVCLNGASETGNIATNNAGPIGGEFIYVVKQRSTPENKLSRAADRRIAVIASQPDSISNVSKRGGIAKPGTLQQHRDRPDWSRGDQ